jgi:glutaredoxin 3
MVIDAWDGSPRSPSYPGGAMSDVIVYTTEPCSFCARVKALLKARGVEFTEVNLAKDPAGRVELAQRTGMMTFPQVIVNGCSVGGFNEVYAAAQDGRLDELLGGSPRERRPPQAPSGSAESAA